MVEAMGEASIGNHVDFNTAARELWSVLESQVRGFCELMALPRNEYDREQDAMLEGQSRGLGLQGEWKGAPDWYGGRIQQVVRLSKSNGTFRYRLDQASMQRSNRFARFLGSRRILQVKLSKELQFSKDNSLSDHLSSRFLFCGRVFAPFASKDSSVYMMEVDEDVERSSDRHQGDNARMSLWDFIDWHNPFVLNMDQVRAMCYFQSTALTHFLHPMNKWLSRFDLGLSTSVPVLRFEPENIEFIPDIGQYMPSFAMRCVY